LTTEAFFQGLFFRICFLPWATPRTCSWCCGEHGLCRFFFYHRVIEILKSQSPSI
jgi:hypothetical protein